jgi:ubiquinone/menaquinone biosynthesis C-methylase UbiE
MEGPLRRGAGRAPALPVLDVGAGTGTFARAFAAWFGVRVVGIEPSAAMREVAERESAHPGVVYRAGSAEAMPLADTSGAVAWLSTVIHHVTDLRALARELRRTLVASAPVLIRSAFRPRS